MDKIEVLRRSDLFHYLDPDDLITVEKMCTTKIFEPGEIIFKQNQEAEEVYVIEAGLVSICLDLGPKDKRQIQAASNFECFGWAATIPPFQHICLAKAIDKTKVLAFNGKDLRNLVDTNPKLCAEIAGGVAYVMSQRLKAAYDQLTGYIYQIR